MSDFVEKYVPEDLRYEDSENQLETIFTKIVSMFEDLLDGDVLNGPSPNIESNFLKEVDELYTYWDVLRNSYYEKVGNLIDPFDLRGIVTTEEEQKGRFLYFLQNIYAIKGTEKAFKFCMKLAGMDAEVIQWYKPEYLLYRQEVESCHSVLRIMIGDHPLTEDMVSLFERLITILLDVCFVVSTWIFVKNLVDDVDLRDEVIENYISHKWKDRYNTCSFEIINRGLAGKYGTHLQAETKREIGIVGYSGNPLFFSYLIPDHNLDDPCPELHNGIFRVANPSSTANEEAAYYDNACGLIHIAPPVIRHVEESNPDIYHNGQHFFNQELDGRRYSYYLTGSPAYPVGEVINALPSILTCGNYARVDSENNYPIPRYLGRTVESNINGFTNLATPICQVDPVLTTALDRLNDHRYLTFAHNGDQTHNDNQDHKGSIYDTHYDLPYSIFKESIVTSLEAIDKPISLFEDKLFDLVLHNSTVTHSQYEHESISHTGVFRYDEIKPSIVNNLAENISINEPRIINEDTDYSVININGYNKRHNSDYNEDSVIDHLLLKSPTIVTELKNIHSSAYLFNNSIFHQNSNRPKKWELDYGGYSYLTSNHHASALCHNTNTIHGPIFKKHIKPNTILVNRNIDSVNSVLIPDSIDTLNFESNLSDIPVQSLKDNINIVELHNSQLTHNSFVYHKSKDNLSSNIVNSLSDSFIFDTPGIYHTGRHLHDGILQINANNHYSYSLNYHGSYLLFSGAYHDSLIDHSILGTIHNSSINHYPETNTWTSKHTQDNIDSLSVTAREGGMTFNNRYRHYDRVMHDGTLLIKAGEDRLIRGLNNWS